MKEPLWLGFSLGKLHPKKMNCTYLRFGRVSEEVCAEVKKVFEDFAGGETFENFTVTFVKEENLDKESLQHKLVPHKKTKEGLFFPALEESLFEYVKEGILNDPPYIACPRFLSKMQQKLSGLHLMSGSTILCSWDEDGFCHH